MDEDRRSSTEYLNSIYFGNGAYGVESAARVYFGKVHGLDHEVGRGLAATPGCGDSTPGLPRPTCASVLAPAEAALLAGMVANPTAFDPIFIPRPPRPGATSCCSDMYQQHYISRSQYEQGISEPLPRASRHRAAPGAAGGALLHELAAPADSGRDGPGPGVPDRSPSTAPTTAG